MKKLIQIWGILSLILFISCSKSNDNNQVSITPVEPPKNTSVIIIMGDGLGIPLLTAATETYSYLNLYDFPYSGLTTTKTANKFITDSGAAATAIFSGQKTNYGFLGVDINQQPLENIYSQLKAKGYKTGILTSSFIADASMAPLYHYGTDRYDHEAIAYDFCNNYPDFCVAGGQKHFDARSDGLNLLDTLSNKGVSLNYSEEQMLASNTLPSMSFMHESRPPYLNDGRSGFLKSASMKAVELFDEDPYFLFIEAALIDIAGHAQLIDRQLEETKEMDEIAGLLLDYAKSREDVLLIVLSDHDTGGISLISDGANGYIPNYSTDEHSGSMTAIFSYGPGAENFSGIMDNTDIYLKISDILNIQ